MFWNGKELNEAIGIQGQLYPMLFCGSLSNSHSYTRSGKFFKTNCYSTFFDIISGKGNTVAIFRNYAKQLSNSIIEPESIKETYNSMKEISNRFKIFKQELLNRILASEMVSGGIRAEFRVRLCDLVSVALAIDKFFSLETLNRTSLVFESSTIINLTKFYIELLSRQITTAITELLDIVQFRNRERTEIMGRIITITIFESLLATSLFTGRTYSFAGNLVWNKSTAQLQSLELMKSVRIFDRPVFRREFFSNNKFRISAPEDILNLIFGKLLKTSNFNFPPVSLIIQFKDEACTDIQKAEILWKIYFDELNPNSFLNNAFPKWKLERLDPVKITTLRGNLKFRGAVKGVFNMNNFREFGSWKNKYYMKLTDSWLTSSKNSISFEILESLLVQAIRNLRIEYVNCPGDETFDPNPTMRIKLDLNDLTDSELVVSMTQDPEFVSIEETIQQRRFREHQEMLEVRNLTNITRQWEYREYVTLFRGIVKYGERGWAKIKSDPTLAFANVRNERSLGTKWRSLKKDGIVVLDTESGKWSVASPFTEKYPPFLYSMTHLETLFQASSTVQFRQQAIYSRLETQRTQPTPMPVISTVSQNQFEEMPLEEFDPRELNDFDNYPILEQTEEQAQENGNLLKLFKIILIYI